MGRLLGGAVEFLMTKKTQLGIAVAILILTLMNAVVYCDVPEGYQPYLHSEDVAVLSIWFNNLRCAFLMILVGIIPCFLGTIVATTMTTRNLVISWKCLSTRMTPDRIALGVLPHSLIEGTCLFLSIALSTTVSCVTTAFLFWVVFPREGPASEPVMMRPDVKHVGIHIAEVALVAIAPLLLLSALVETYISPLALNYG